MMNIPDHGIDDNGVDDALMKLMGALFTRLILRTGRVYVEMDSVCLCVITSTFPLKALLDHSGRMLDLIS